MFDWGAACIGFAGRGDDSRTGAVEGALDERGRDLYQLLTCEEVDGSGIDGIEDDAPPIMPLISSYETRAGTKLGAF